MVFGRVREYHNVCGYGCGRYGALWGGRRREDVCMLRIGAVAYGPYVVTIFEGIKRHFHRQGVELDWVLYSNYDALVDTFVSGEIAICHGTGRWPMSRSVVPWLSPVRL
jgi:hypothetical protein